MMIHRQEEPTIDPSICGCNQQQQQHSAAPAVPTTRPSPSGPLGTSGPPETRSRGCRQLERLALFLVVAQILFEFNSVTLFLWPLDHSCARPANLSIYSDLFVDGSRQPIDLDAVQTNLFDATAEDSFTVARASSMGINYHDIGHCFEYPVEYDQATRQPTINMESLEPCKHGLRFEEFTPRLSILATYGLACQRQWLKILVPQSMALGLILGSLLTYVCLSRPSTNHHWRWWWCSWALLVLSSSLLALYLASATAMDGHPRENSLPATIAGHFSLFLMNVLLRSQTLGALLLKIITTSGKRGPTDTSTHRLAADHSDFIVIVLIFILFKTLYLPIALRLLTSWSQLNQILSINVTITTSLLLIHEFYLSNSLRKRLRSEGGDSRVTKLLGDEAPVPEMDEAISVGGDLAADLENPFTVMTTTINVQVYQPTTLPAVCCLFRDTDTARPHDPPSVKKQLNNSNRARGTLLEEHYENLFRSPTRIHLHLLLFCLVFNYYLIQMMPNHRLLHSETIKSLMGRKIDFRETHPRSAPIGSNGTSAATSEGSKSAGLTTLFDYRNVDYATRAIDSMRSSSNLVEILWTTIRLNDWPLELLVVLLHVTRWSVGFQSAYFKLGRLFSLVSIGARMLAFEWLLLALMRNQNHLLELSWLLSGFVLLAKLTASLMLFNYMNTILKLRRLLVVSNVMDVTLALTSSFLAVMLAASASVVEKVDLVIIPLMALINNLIVYWSARLVGRRFKEHLCPMIFDDH